MSENLNTIEVGLHLTNIEELFAEPEADPFNPESRYVSGMDDLVNQLATRRLGYKKIRILFTLPAQAINTDLGGKTKAALDRYCEAQIEASQHELAQLRQRGRFSLVSSVVIILIAVLLVALVARLDFLSDMFKTFLVGGLSVFSWVAIWEPFSIYLYEWRPPARNCRIHEKLKGAELVFEPGD